ncbi:hypothetical protein ATANTOWER_002733 [Ataeniobius toweri]|uniref:Uncharacterized protein n=1 Tax=Ataeniobius toweri TaxID=208326 RepID=A0ABU7BMT6_9TELE|nr:hypothetical protein [Ataeniobius toweri]
MPSRVKNVVGVVTLSKLCSIIKPQGRARIYVHISHSCSFKPDNKEGYHAVTYYSGRNVFARSSDSSYPVSEQKARIQRRVIDVRNLSGCWSDSSDDRAASCTPCDIVK